MPLNKYIGWTKVELEQKLRDVQETLSTGRPTKVTILGVTTENDPYNKGLNLESVLKDILYSLYVLDPDKYPDNPFQQKTMKIVTNYC